MKINTWLVILTLSTFSNTAFATDYDAVIDLPRPVELSLPVSGVIKTLNVTAGQYVKQGDAMLSLDPVPFQAEKRHAESRLAVQQTLLTESLRDLKNRQELYDRTVLSTVQLENAELKVKRDKAFVKNAEAQLAIADYQLSYSKLAAPFNALVLSVHVNSGQSINNAIASKTLITLAQKGHYVARFSVPAEDVEPFTTGQKVAVTNSGNTIAGVISGISLVNASAGANSNKNSSRYFTVEAGFKSDLKHVVGSKATVRLN